VFPELGIRTVTEQPTPGSGEETGPPPQLESTTARPSPRLAVTTRRADRSRVGRGWGAKAGSTPRIAVRVADAVADATVVE
jgi:hypothetical protein